ncbi:MULTISPECIES: hypothetical protein [Falsihalocynthiibacter]|uniref:hypothetical protein n=1 Tax=Falsihalocynthiibacter TaxID=2854182 RepID=UPI003003565A
MNNFEHTAKQLSALYLTSFGGKDSGRYRIASKVLRDMLDRKRLYPEDIQSLSRALLEEGYILIDMDTFFVVLSAKTFVNYRRANADSVLGLED